jgi:hypothetical protein
MLDLVPLLMTTVFAIFIRTEGPSFTHLQATLQRPVIACTFLSPAPATV